MCQSRPPVPGSALLPTTLRRLPAAGPLAALSLLVLLTVAACSGGGPPPPPPADGGDRADRPWFTEAPAGAGLDFVHFNGMSGTYHLAEITCGGGALLDADGDGDLDLYLLQGRMLEPGAEIADPPAPPRHPLPLTDRLYRNELAETGRLAFTDVTAAAGLTAGELATGYGCGVAGGDFDGDGHPDLFLGNLGPDRLLRNRGDGTFENATARAGFGDAGSAVAPVPFDLDRDGDLDLFVGNYVRFVFDGAPRCRDLTGAPDWCGPEAFEAEPDRLYRNRGDGTFEEVTAAAGLAAPPRPALGAVAADLDGDGWSDLYVGNDGQPNHLWMNRGDGTFRDEALLAGAAVNAAGAAEASMGVAAGDADNDGDPDLALTHLDKETNTLYLNRGGGLFADATSASGLGPPSAPFTGFGLAWLDVDNDGLLDLAVVNGAVVKIPTLAATGDPFPLHQTNQLFRNLGPGADGVPRFADVTAEAGAAFRRSETSRGLLAGDLDDDGDVDLVVLNNNGPARLLLNARGQDRPWLGLRLVTGDPPRHALGAVATLRRRGAPDLTRHAHTDGSYVSAGDPRLLFGLGGGTEVTAVDVRWPDGGRETFPPPPAGRYTTLARGSGSPTGDPP